MRVLWSLFLRRFKKFRYNIPLSCVLLLSALFRWLFWGIFETLFFDILIKRFGGGGVVGDYLLNHPEGIFYALLAFGLLTILFLMYFDARKELKSQNLTDTLTTMQKRLIQIKKTRLAHSRLDEGSFEQAAPILMDKLGIIEFDQWGKYVSRIKQRARQRIPQNPKNKNFLYKVLGLSSNIKQELFSAKEWALDDSTKVVEWADSFGWGLTEYRDKDQEWNRLYDSIRPYTFDDKLRNLIDRHLSYSLAYCTITMIQVYSAKWPSNTALSLLHSALVGRPTSPVEADKDLNEILSQINERLKILDGEKNDIHTS